MKRTGLLIYGDFVKELIVIPKQSRNLNVKNKKIKKTVFFKNIKDKLIFHLLEFLITKMIIIQEHLLHGIQKMTFLELSLEEQSQHLYQIGLLMLIMP